MEENQGEEYGQWGHIANLQIWPDQPIFDHPVFFVHDLFFFADEKDEKDKQTFENHSYWNPIFPKRIKNLLNKVKDFPSSLDAIKGDKTQKKYKLVDNYIHIFDYSIPKKCKILSEDSDIMVCSEMNGILQVCNYYKKKLSA